MSITSSARGWTFSGIVNGRYIEEFVSRKDADNLSEAIAVRIERLGF